jgi:site-specific DNA-methyltransferase (adenine-specific)
LLVTGDVLDHLRQYEDNSYHCSLSDPPYGLRPIGSRLSTGINGEAWDGDVLSVEVARELLRVCKPGASLLGFGHPRTYDIFVHRLRQAGWVICDCLMWLYGQGMGKSHDLGQRDVAWRGYRSSLRPSYEPIVYATKQRVGTYIDNALQFGVAGLNLDACRFGSGRLPTNTIIDEEAGRLLDEEYRHRIQNGVRADDDRRVSRFFYCPKANRHERNAGVQASGGGNVSAGTSHGCGLFDLCGLTSQPNPHLCLKPLALTEWLATLLLPPEASRPRMLIVPYCGSGSEIIGAMLARWDYIVGIDQNPAYIEIARQRIEYWARRAGITCYVRILANGRQRLSTITPSRPSILRRRLHRRNTVLVTADPADMAVLRDLGFDVVLATPESVEQVRSSRPEEVVVVRRRTFGGHRAAERAADALLAYVPSMKIVAPVVADDVHASWRGRLTAAKLQQLIDATPALELTITTMIR